MNATRHHAAHPVPSNDRKQISVPQGILAVLLAAMAILQLSDPAGFRDVIRTYDLGPAAVANLLAVGLILGESLAAIGLVAPAPPAQRVAARIGLLVAGMWTCLAVQAFVRNLVLPNCGCFGVHLTQPLRWWILIEDVEFLALAVVALRRTDQTAS